VKRLADLYPMLDVLIVNVLVGALVVCLHPSLAQAQQSPSATPSAATTALQDLSKDSRNPFVGFIKVPVEATTGFDVGAHHNAGENINIEPLIPIDLGPDWDLIARPSFNVTYTPSPGAAFGFQDLQTSFFLTPDKAATWLWGAGPIFQFPTASRRELGTGRWSAGPTAALTYNQGPWFNAILTYQLMSFAGSRRRGRSVQCDPQMTLDWTAESSNAWSIPLGADVARTFQLGEQALNVQAGAYDNVERPDGAPQWFARLQLTYLFPE
jgi:hypothetical protein